MKINRQLALISTQAREGVERVTVARHVPDTFPCSDVGTPEGALEPRGGADEPGEPADWDYSNPVVFLGRLKPGCAPESRRLVHVFLLTSEARHSSTLTARCGETLPVDDTQWLPNLAGMPCEHCLLHSLAER
jgi:hypothetical protein